MIPRERVLNCEVSDILCLILRNRRRIPISSRVGAVPIPRAVVSNLLTSNTKQLLLMKDQMTH